MLDCRVGGFKLANCELKNRIAFGKRCCFFRRRAIDDHFAPDIDSPASLSRDLSRNQRTLGSLIILDRLDVIAELDQVLDIEFARQLGVVVLRDLLILRGILVDGGEKLLGGRLVRFRSGNTILVGIANGDVQVTGGIERRAGLALLVLIDLLVLL
ncbi:hypothetical protein [Agrobacterium tumefaciens]|uniref:hypothetical protein n=1 Tax=Agrobacterium tumefaciens TaxID=358 RepID=UPI000760E0F4|nr:hypothetical protein [Agrobacterium tumefaciens]KWT86875.1 hypothetical protein ASB65_23275 [Agrobacterium tumefaciens str. B6]MQB26437.1 hypothetical protein [Agrobacterium tumefaciens]OCJ28892.1 hypothetical protein A6U90_15220 [Agrobacterium tumefaciens]